jgi:hypothetical protein
MPVEQDLRRNRVGGEDSEEKLKCRTLRLFIQFLTPPNFSKYRHGGSADSRRLQIHETFLVHHPIERLVSSTVKLQSKLHRLHTTGERSVSRRAYRKALPDFAQISFNSLLLD